jgi:L-ascorbate oxidase
VHDDTFVPDFVLRVTYETVDIACQSRLSVLVNGTSPGPAITLPPGKTSWIRVYNDMEDLNTTMHWHGLSQALSPFADGTPSVSQWSIPPKNYFDYELHPLLKESGTYFYHSHVGFQAGTSSGPLIVADRSEPPYAYDGERIVFIQDHFKKDDLTIEAGLRSENFTWSGETNAVLINGVGVSINETASTGGCGMPVIEVDPGKTYRMRFVGATALSLVQFAIVDHDNFTIIEADGSYTKPYTVDHMQLASGQRFDALFTTKTKEELNGQTDYVIQFETKDRPAVFRGYGILRYSKAAPQITTAPSTVPLTLTNATYEWAEYALEPIKNNNFPKASEVTRRVIIDGRQLKTYTTTWHLNGLAWNDTVDPLPGDKPYLVNIYENGAAAIPDYDAAIANDGWDPTTLTWPAKVGEVRKYRRAHCDTSILTASSGPRNHLPKHRLPRQQQRRRRLPPLAPPRRTLLRHRFRQRNLRPHRKREETRQLQPRPPGHHPPLPLRHKDNGRCRRRVARLEAPRGGCRSVDDPLPYFAAYDYGHADGVGYGERE